MSLEDKVILRMFSLTELNRLFPMGTHGDAFCGVRSKDDDYGITRYANTAQDELGGWLCTRPVKHEGPHVACSSFDSVYAAWISKGDQ